VSANDGNITTQSADFQAGYIYALRSIKWAVREKDRSKEKNVELDLSSFLSAAIRWADPEEYGIHERPDVAEYLLPVADEPGCDRITLALMIHPQTDPRKWGEIITPRMQREKTEAEKSAVEKAGL
jgi:hypothetical protein